MPHRHIFKLFFLALSDIFEKLRALARAGETCLWCVQPGHDCDGRNLGATGFWGEHECDSTPYAQDSEPAQEVESARAVAPTIQPWPKLRDSHQLPCCFHSGLGRSRESALGPSGSAPSFAPWGLYRSGSRGPQGRDSTDSTQTMNAQQSPRCWHLWALSCVFCVLRGPWKVRFQEARPWRGMCVHTDAS